MHHVRQENLPFVGSSHGFIGVEQGDTGISVFLFNGKPGSGPGPHRHPYDEIQFIRAGLTVNLLVAARVEDILPKLAAAARAVAAPEKEMTAAAAEKM